MVPRGEFYEKKCIDLVLECQPMGGSSTSTVLLFEMDPYHAVELQHKKWSRICRWYQACSLIPVWMTKTIVSFSPASDISELENLTSEKLYLERD